MNFAIFLISGWFNRRIEEVMTKKKDATSYHCHIIELTENTKRVFFLFPERTTPCLYLYYER